MPMETYNTHVYDQTREKQGEVFGDLQQASSMTYTMRNLGLDNIADVGFGTEATAEKDMSQPGKGLSL